MIHIVTPDKRSGYIKELGEMFLKRNMAGDYGFDFQGITQDAQDVFDTSEAVYILYSENSKVEGGVRLLPTIGLHILDGGCVGLFDASAKFPPDNKIWECSRFFFNTALSAKESEKIAKLIFQGILEFCMAREIYHLTAVFSQKIHHTLLHFGWPLRIVSQSTVFDVISSLILVFQDCANFSTYKSSREGENFFLEALPHAYSQHPIYKLEKINNDLLRLTIEKQKVERELKEKLVEDLAKCNALSVPYETLMGGILEIIATYAISPEKAQEWKKAGQQFIFPETVKANNSRSLEENVYPLRK